MARKLSTAVVKRRHRGYRQPSARKLHTNDAAVATRISKSCRIQRKSDVLCASMISRKDLIRCVVYVEDIGERQRI